MVRLLQCANRFVVCWWDDKRGWDLWKNAVNGGKYISCITAVFTSTLSFFHSGNKFAFAGWITAWVFKSLYCFIWDISQDWGLSWKFERKNMLYGRFWYFFAAVTNLIARSTWGVALAPQLCPGNFTFGLAVIEILRRAQWAVFRVEYESFSTAHHPFNIQMQGI